MPRHPTSRPGVSLKTALSALNGATGQDVSVSDIRINTVMMVVQVTVRTSDNKAAKSALGRILRTAASAAELAGIIVPVTGLVKVEQAEACMGVALWAADQDWHRGDFRIVLENDDSGDSAAALLQAGLGESWDDIERLHPITEGEYVKQVESELRASNVKGQHAELVQTVVSAIRQGTDTGQAVNGWLAMCVDEARGLLSQEQGSFEEGEGV